MSKKEVTILVLVCSLVFNFVLFYDVYKMITLQDDAREYIRVLEEQVGDDLLDTVGGTDEYAAYYQYLNRK